MKKILVILFSFLSIIITQSIYGQESSLNNEQRNIDTKEFINDYQDNIDSILGSFVLNKEYPLGARIFDIADKQVYSFLESSASWKTKGEMMANFYYPYFFVNNKETSFCFILYDSKSTLLEGYLRLLNYNEMLDYLTFHEMGHCLEDYIKHTSKKKISDNREDTELFADIFTMTNLLYLKKDIQAEKVIKVNEFADKKDFHYQPKRLIKALGILKAMNINEIVGKPNINKVVDISKNVFISLKKDELIHPNFATTEDKFSIQSKTETSSGWTITRTK